MSGSCAHVRGLVRAETRDAKLTRLAKLLAKRVLRQDIGSLLENIIRGRHFCVG